MNKFDKIAMESFDNLNGSDGTKLIYNVNYTRLIKPNLGDLYIEDITQYTLIQLMNELSYKYSKSSMKIIKATISCIFRYAMEEYSLETNVQVHKLYTGSKKNIKREKILLEEDFHSLIRYLETSSPKNASSYRLAIMIAHYTGMRSGEILALNKSDIDLRRNKINVTKKIVVSRIDGETKIYTEQPKSEHSVRDVAINKKLKKLIIPYLNEGTGDILITDTDGKYITPNKLSSFLWHFTKGKNMRITMHMFRHTFATTLLHSGVSPEIVQTILGHSSVAVTLGIYSHRMDSEYHEAINLIR